MASASRAASSGRQRKTMSASFIAVRLAASSWRCSSGSVISEISFLTGFSNPSYFIKTFKAAYGMTPAVFKASLGKKSPKNKE